jgi:hypothetical protein
MPGTFGISQAAFGRGRSSPSPTFLMTGYTKRSGRLVVIEQFDKIGPGLGPTGSRPPGVE